MSHSTLPWIEKYRPTDFDGIISQENIVKTFRILIERKTLPHTLLYGMPGTGKTSTIMVCAKIMYGEYYPYMVLNLNASDARGIQIVRNIIKQFVLSKSIVPNEMHKLVILDEVDAMTLDAQAILQKIMEDFSYCARFCLICNNIQYITLPLQSRCIKFRFSPLHNEQDNFYNKMCNIAKCENIQYAPDGINAIIKRSKGDMRTALNILQSTCNTFDTITELNVNYSCGYPLNSDTILIIDALFTQPLQTAFETINNIKRNNHYSLCDIINEIHDYIYDIILTNKQNPHINKLTQDKLIIIFENLKQIEINQYTSAVEDVQVSALVSIFKII